MAKLKTSFRAFYVHFFKDNRNTFAVHLAVNCSAALNMQLR